MPSPRGGPAAGVQRAAAAPLAPRRLELGQSVNRNSWGLTLIVSPSWRAVGVFWWLRLACAHLVRLQRGSKIGDFGAFWTKKRHKSDTPRKKSVSHEWPYNAFYCGFWSSHDTFPNFFANSLYTCAYMRARTYACGKLFTKSVKKCQLINKNGFILRSIGVFRLTLFFFEMTLLAKK